jgi:uncharacterized membrane protein (UPF0127 family)
MDTERVRTALSVLVFLVLVAGVLVVSGIVPLPVPAPEEYERTTVTAIDDNGTELGTVRVRVADTFQKRYTGLSDTESLAPDEGMLFAYEEEGSHAFVMREMDFPLDIVFVDANGTVTAVHHAPVPPPGTAEHELTRYRGRGKWVLEVNRNWTTHHGVEVGDRIVVNGTSVDRSKASPTPSPTPDSYDSPTVTAEDANGTELGTVRVRVADTFQKRYTGLSDTESLAPDEGMLFVYEEEGSHAFVMREMDFPLDIVFADANGTVTAVHHAPVPPPGTAERELTRYRGRGKWVLEVNRNWTTRHGVEVGDRIVPRGLNSTGGTATPTPTEP